VSFPDDDLRHLDPLFQREKFESGLRIMRRLSRLAEKYGKTPAQTAIAWVLAQDGVICALSGPSTVEHLEENVEASGIQFEPDDLAAFEEFLAEEDLQLADAQREAIQSILEEPLEGELQAAFVDLIYVIETAIDSQFITEKEVLPVFQELFALREKLDEAAYSKLQEIQTRLRNMIFS
jgi:hypothetical protein